MVFLHIYGPKNFMYLNMLIWCCLAHALPQTHTRREACHLTTYFNQSTEYVNHSAHICIPANIHTKTQSHTKTSHVWEVFINIGTLARFIKNLMKCDVKICSAIQMYLCLKAYCYFAVADRRILFIYSVDLWRKHNVYLILVFGVIDLRF